MATKPATVAVILEQAAGAGRLSARKMFGEYAIYCGGTLVALVCDDRLYLKPTEAGRACLGSVIEAAPYPGAKPCFLVPGEAWDDAEAMAGLFAATAAALPAPVPRKPRARGARAVPVAAPRAGVSKRSS